MACELLFFVFFPFSSINTLLLVKWFIQLHAVVFFAPLVKFFYLHLSFAPNMENPTVEGYSSSLIAIRIPFACCYICPSSSWFPSNPKSFRLAEMKLLGWMHRKFRQNGGEELKDLGGAAGGGTCNCLAGRPSLDLDLNRRRYHYDPLKARSLRLHVEALSDGGGGADPIEEEFFEGLLTIGTLGVGTGPIEEKMEEEEEMKELAVIEEVERKPLLPASEEVAVLAIPAALEAIAEKEAEATTETDLIMVNAELEKVLTAEEEKSGGRMSSARSSHAGAAACPLQGFLFGLPVEAAETVLMEAEAAAGYRKERRASLGELFMMSRITEEGEAKFAGGDGEGKLTAEMCWTKKKPTKHRGRKGSPDGVNAFNSSSTMEKKFQKILQLFHKKVHPESTIMSKNPSKTGKTEKVNASKATSRKENSNAPPSSASSVSDSTGKNNRGHWIKTDAEYLVLEL